LDGYSSRGRSRGKIDDLDIKALCLEHLPECTREPLLVDNPPDGRPIGSFYLAPRLLQQFDASLEDRQKVQLLGDPLRVAGGLDLEENSLVVAIEVHLLVTDLDAVGVALGCPVL
jgi:hypothetical protein